MTPDPFVQVQRFLTQARNESENYRRQVSALQTEMHQVGRQLERCRERNRTLEEQVATLEVAAKDAQSDTKAARRAMLEHAGRST